MNENLIIGEIYTVTEKNNRNIFRWGGYDSSEYLGQTFASNSYDGPSAYVKGGGSFKETQCRLSTKQERSWLEQCSRLGKFIEFNLVTCNIELNNYQIC